MNETEPNEAMLGKVIPRVWTDGGDLPSKGQEMIDFCKEIGIELLPWQEWLAIEMHKVLPNGK